MTQGPLEIKKWSETISDQVESIFFGKRGVIRKILISILARGHILLEDVPGTGKTIVARALSATLGMSFKRIQCTPDLMPADVLGVSIWMPASNDFIFRHGPVFSHIVLVDEINRATPRTQSALLEAMGERQVSIDGSVYELPDPFFIIATENPIEFEGTFPLPEAQKDRFLLSVDIGYPASEAEALILESQRRLNHPVTDLKPLCAAEDILELQRYITKIHVDEGLRSYILALINETRGDAALRLGVSPRGSLALYKAAQASAALAGRSYVVPNDIKDLAPDVFRKRVVLQPETQIRGITADRVIKSIIERVPIPAFKEGL